MRIIGSLVIVVALAISGCASGRSTGTTTSDHHSEIPDVGEDQLAVAVPGFDLAVGGPQRFVVGLFTADKTDIGFGTVALRFRWFGDGGGSAADAAFGDPVVAEFRLLPGSAGGSPIDVPTVLTPDEGRGVYVANATFDRAGFWEVEVQGAVQGLNATTGTGAFEVAPETLVPARGEIALASDNATLETIGVAPESLDSRATGDGVPDPELHDITLRRAIETHAPAVVVFSTPTYCLSRFCGPVTDMVAELASRYEDRAAFIHIEIWQDFDQQRLNPTAEEWLSRDGNLQEPWVFLIGADGRIVDRWDNVVIRDDLVGYLDALPVIAGS